MGLVQSAFLLALGGLAIPVIIHLIFRWQTRRVDLGTTRFLAELLRETARRRRLKRWLLLTLRLACIALLALLFARPFLLAQQRSGDRRLLVFLVDKSASMTLRADGERLVDRAVTRVKEIAREAGEKADFEIGFFDTEVQSVGAEDAETEPDIDRLQAPEFAFGATSYGAAMSWARDVCLKSPHAEREVYLFTDLQRSGLDWTDAASFPEGVRVHIEDLGRDDVNNVSIARVASGKTLIRPGEGTTVAITLFNYGAFDLDEVPVLLVLKAGQRTVRLQEKTSLPAGQATELEFEINALDSGLWEGTVSVDVEDELPFDNRQHLAMLSARPQRVLIVDGTADPEAPLPETFFLERAVRLAVSGEVSADSPFTPTSVRYEEEGRLPPLADTDLVVLADVGQVSRADASALNEFVRTGGGLLVFTGEQMTAEGCETLAEVGLAPGTIDGVARTNDLPFRWDWWEDRHSALQPFADPQHGDLRRLGFTAYTEVTPASGTNVLATFLNKDPALTEHRLGEGRVLWFLSSCGRSWGDWVRSRLFLPVVHQLLGDLANLTSGGPVQMHLFEGTQPLLGASSLGAPIAERPGIVEQDGRYHVFNVSSRESETDRCTPPELADRFQFIWEVPGATVEKGDRMVGLESRRDEIWPWVACVLIGVMFLEWFVSNRTTA